MLSDQFSPVGDFIKLLRANVVDVNVGLSSVMFCLSVEFNLKTPKVVLFQLMAIWCPFVFVLY